MPQPATPVRTIVKTCVEIMDDPKATRKERLLAAATVIRVTRRHAAFRRAKDFVDEAENKKLASSGLERLMQKVEGADSKDVQ